MTKISHLVGMPALICVLFFYFSCGLALQQGVAIPATFYWLLFLAVPSISLLLISNNETYNVLILLVNAICVYSMFFLQNTTWYPSGRDTQFEMQIVSLIHNKGVWTPSMGTAMGIELSVHPAMHIFLASLCSVTGLQPYHVMFIVPWLKGVVFTLFFYLFSRNFLSDARSVFFASILFMGCIFFVGYTHRQTFAEILFMGALWIYSKKKTSLEMKTALMLLIFSLAMAHHFTAYILLLIVAALYLFEKRREMIHPLLPTVAVLSWAMFVSLTLTSMYMIKIFEALEMVMTLTPLEGPTLAATSYYYTPFENLLMLMNPVLIGIMALPPFLKEMRSRNKIFLLVITLVSGGLLVAGISFFLFKTQLKTAFYRVWDFAYIPLSIWASLFFWKRFRNARLRTAVSIAIILILFASMNLSTINGIKKWYVPRGYMESFRFSDSMVNTAHWCNTHLNGSILGDNLAYCSVASWGYKEVDQYAFNMWYRTKNNELLRNFDYIILSPWDTVTYSDIFRKPIDPFALLPEILSVVYSSGDLIVYINSSR